MSVVELFPTSPPEVYLRMALLKEPPAHVWRRDGITLLTCDPRASRFEITARNMEILTSEEADVIRLAYGLPRINERAPDWITDDAPAFLYVPASLRLAGAAPIQGGRVMVARRRAGQLDDEMAAWMQERDQPAQRGA